MGVTNSHTWAEIREYCDTVEDVLLLRNKAESAKPRADKPQRRAYQNDKTEVYVAEFKSNKSNNNVPPPKSYDGSSRHPNRPPRKYSFEYDAMESLLALLLKQYNI